jgi:8-oxo-dGTP diphosphatase
MALMGEPEAAVAIVKARMPEESILLIRRAERESDSWSGHWSLPGGRREPQDRDLLQTALRELAEECGVVLSREDLSAELPYATARRKVGAHLLVAPFVFCIEATRPTVLDPAEAAAALWVPLSDLRNPARHGLTSVPGLPKEVRYPAIELAGLPLWGFTYRLLTDWLALPFRDQLVPERSS